MGEDVDFDFDRPRRTGLSEAVLCVGKTAAQVAAVMASAIEGGTPLLLTRLEPAMVELLAQRRRLDYDPLSRTGILGRPPRPAAVARVAVVSAGSADQAVAREAVRTLAFYGEAAAEASDVGVAGLWRLLEREEALRRFPVLIVVAGMDGALFSVVGGLLPGVVIAVPTAGGYGVTRGGETALNAALASCAPGVVAVNIDNGYGAACAAVRVLKALDGKLESCQPG